MYVALCLIVDGGWISFFVDKTVYSLDEGVVPSAPIFDLCGGHGHEILLERYDCSFEKERRSLRS